MIVNVADVLVAIDLFLKGQVDATELEAWAERREMAEDVEYCEAERDIIAEVIFRLANPAINGAITVENIEKLRESLQR